MTHFEELSAKLSEPMEDAAEFAKLSKEYSDLTPIAEKILEWQNLVEEQKSLEDLLADPGLEKDMKDFAQDLSLIHI